MLQSSVERHPERPALIFGDRRLDYAALSTEVDRLADRLGALATRGERVALIAPNVPALVIAMFASWRLGAVAVPLNARLREYELRQVLADAEPAAIVSLDTHQGYSFADAISSLMPHLPTVRGCLLLDAEGRAGDERKGAARASAAPELPPDVIAVLYTSGTTGRPKGALVTLGSAEASAEALAERLALTPADVTALVVPASHAFGLGCLLAALAAGSCTVLVDAGFSLDPVRVAMREHGASVLHGSPALFARLLATERDLFAQVRTGFVAGAHCPPVVLERLDEAGPMILNLFGMTEMGAAAGCRSDDAPELRHKTVGRPLPGFEFRAAGGSAPDDPGELQVRGPHVTPGYLGKPDETAAAFDGDWFRTGDLGTIDELGYVRVAGRAKEVVHVAGFNVFPAEVEAFLLTHPDVAQAVVVGVPHEKMGEVLAAYVVPSPGADLTPGALLRFARPRIAGYKLPYAISVVDELPLLPSGKPDRVALAAGAEQREPAGVDR
ncbi:MAG: acyl--CoA ligase [Thermoleophilaceae bacterium]|nr:acyl--CoA ligase [Thermoleophilaceae bacterium]